MARVLLLGLAVCANLLWAGGALAACRQALVMALDVSGSVDADEYQLQLHGLAAALEDPDVQAALFQQPDIPIYLTVFEWSGQNYQRLISPWVALSTPEALTGLTALLRGWQRQEAAQTTSLGGALLKSAALLQTAPPCWRRTIDISGDGQNNDWPQPQDVRKRPEFDGVTINALVIAQGLRGQMDHQDSDVAELSAYFTHQIIQGPDAFIEVAIGFDDYAEAMTRKLLRELQTIAIGQVQPLEPMPAPSKNIILR